MADVEIFTTPWCPYCVAAKRLLTERGAAYREVDVSDDPGARVRLAELSGQETVPQIFIDGESIGGFDELSRLDRCGALSGLLGV